MQLKKDVYKMLSSRYETMLRESENYSLKLARKLNLKQITDEDYQQSIMDWEDEMFAISFQLWRYELNQALKEYTRQEKKFLQQNQNGLVELINATAPKEKFNWRLLARISKLHFQVMQECYKDIISKSKNVPVHSIDRNKFPVRPIDLINPE